MNVRKDIQKSRWPQSNFILQNCPLHYRTFCIPVYWIPVYWIPFWIPAYWRWVASSRHWDKQKHPLYFPMLCLRGSRPPCIVYYEDYRVVPKVQCSVGCSASLTGVPQARYLCLQYLNMRLELQSSTNHSPAWTRSLNCSSSRTSNTTDSASFCSNLCPHLTSRFPCYPCFSGPETSFLFPPTLLPTHTCGRAIKACYFFAQGLFHMPCF